MATICQPLKDHLGIDHFTFHYEKVNWKTKQIATVLLSSSYTVLDIFHDYYAKKPSYKIDITANLENYNKYYNQYLLDSSKVADFAHSVYGIHNVLRKLEKINNNEWLRIVFATTSADPSFLNLYFNYLHSLEKFILYFKEKSAQLFKQAATKILLSDHFVDQPDHTTEINVKYGLVNLVLLPGFIYRYIWFLR